MELFFAANPHLYVEQGDPLIISAVRRGNKKLAGRLRSAGAFMPKLTERQLADLRINLRVGDIPLNILNVFQGGTRKRSKRKHTRKVRH